LWAAYRPPGYKLKRRRSEQREGMSEMRVEHATGDGEGTDEEKEGIGIQPT